MKKTPLVTSKTLAIVNSIIWNLLLGLSVLRGYAFSQSEGNEYSIANQLSYNLSYYYPMWLLSYYIYWSYQKTKDLEWPRVLHLHIGNSLLFSLVHLILMSSVMTVLATWLDHPMFADKSMAESWLMSIKWDWPMMTSSIIVYWILTLIIFGWDYYRKFKNQYIQNLKLESQLSQSQLQTLKMQLQPHFLFNALNTISMLVRRKKDEQAVDMISGLSDLLRSTLTRENDQLVPLTDELELAQKYLDIEQVRFKENIKVIYEIEEKSRMAMVPNMLLQPLIENAIKHGLSKTMGQGCIKIKSAVERGFLNIEVMNTAPFLDTAPDPENGNGIGLNNTQQRLEQLYKEDHSFEILYQEPVGVIVKMKFPIKPQLSRAKSA
jgi:sensor histidine kinase YesM